MFCDIPQHSTRFHHILSHCDIPSHSMMFHDILECSRGFQGIPGYSTVFHTVPPHSMVGPCGSMGAYLCLAVFVFVVSLCGCVGGHVYSLSGLGVALWGCAGVWMRQQTCMSIVVRRVGCRTCLDSWLE